MSNWSDLTLRANASILREFGDRIVYLPAKGAGDPIETAAIQQTPQIDQSTSPGYFMDAQLDPLVITNPVRGDEVIWGSGDDAVAYVVAKVLRPDAYSLFTVALHRKLDQ